MRLTCDDTTALCANRLRAQYSLRGRGLITLVSQPDSSGHTKELNVSPEWLFLILEGQYLQSFEGLRGQALSRAKRLKVNTFKLLERWLNMCAGSSGTLH